MDTPEGIPGHLLGYKIKTRWQIIFGWIIPTCFELIAYIIQTVTDIGVVAQHFREGNHLYGGLTLLFLCLPAFVCFVLIVTSSWQWPNSKVKNKITFNDYYNGRPDNNYNQRYTSSNSSNNGTVAANYDNFDDSRKFCTKINLKFFFKQFLNMIFFPFGAIYRFSYRIFWSIDSIFYEKGTYERQHGVSKSAETSPFELYHFVQAYTQSAPQIILQLFILLEQNVYRNYETTNIQVLSIVFSLINLATITMSYQRFESQKIVGRYYPWSSKDQIKYRNMKFSRTRSYIEEREKNRRVGIDSIREFPENEKILQRFYSKQEEKETNQNENDIDDVQKTGRGIHPNGWDSSLIVHDEADSNQKKTMNNILLENVTDDEKLETVAAAQNVAHSPNNDELSSYQQHHLFLVTVENKQSNDGINLEEEDINHIKIIEEAPPKDYRMNKLRNEYIPSTASSLSEILIEEMDNEGIPETPPPNPPAPSKGKIPQAIERLSILGNMLILDAQNYIKDHVPHPPQILLERDHQKQQQQKEEREINHKSRSQSKEIHRRIADNSLSETNNINKKNDDDRDDDYNDDGYTVNSNINRRNKNNVPNLSSDSTLPASTPSPSAPGEAAAADEVDYFLPRRRKIIKGIEQDDFFGKCTAFFGWLFIILMRMLSLGLFAHFFLKGFNYLVSIHYGVMLMSLLYGTKLHGKKTINRILFYIFLAYVYIFVLIEFRVKFKRIRLWYFGHFSLVMLQNFLMTLYWYSLMNPEEPPDSWIFDFLFWIIILSGVLSISCMIIYYVILKPADVILVENVK